MKTRYFKELHVTKWRLRDGEMEVQTVTGAWVMSVYSSLEELENDYIVGEIDEDGNDVVYEIPESEVMEQRGWDEAKSIRELEN